MSMSKGKVPTNSVEIPPPSCRSLDIIPRLVHCQETLRPSVKKMVEAYGGSPEWKPGYLFVKASEKYCVAWNQREVEGLRVIKDEWSKEDDDSVEEFADDLNKILKYSKLVKWSDAQHYVPPVLVEEGKDTNTLVEEEKDEEESTTVAARANKKRKRLVKDVILMWHCSNLRGEAVVGLKRLSGDRPIKAKWFKQFLKESPKETVYEALVKVLTKLSSEQLPLWEVLCKALVKMGTPEDMAMFPGDPAIVLSKGPSDEEPIPEVLDEYIDIELEEEGDEASREDVSDTGNSGAQKNAGGTSLSHPKDGSAGQDAI
ncbi:OLC1v1001782C1 [Oldenlandia corymbosa var. corymbosa]|uniref:OLC1v1001782C1 n=1 Tax=Oldenlandia corymbosa var. corymbosa TaxID=529605 RepID=A0AAV1D639_OLDCO|nr:OLC1v1001782C1 [Oldenlandia corymbosa var. corymbosa]